MRLDQEAHDQLDALLAAVRAGDTSITDDQLYEAFFQVTHAISAPYIIPSLIWDAAPLCTLRPGLTDRLLRHPLAILVEEFLEEDESGNWVIGVGAVEGIVDWATGYVQRLPEEHQPWLEQTITSGEFRRMCEEEVGYFQRRLRLERELGLPGDDDEEWAIIDKRRDLPTAGARIIMVLNDTTPLAKDMFALLKESTVSRLRWGRIPPVDGRVEANPFSRPVQVHQILFPWDGLSLPQGLLARAAPPAASPDLPLPQIYWLLDQEIIGHVTREATTAIDQHTELLISALEETTSR